MRLCPSPVSPCASRPQKSIDSPRQDDGGQGQRTAPVIVADDGGPPLAHREQVDQEDPRGQLDRRRDAGQHPLGQQPTTAEHPRPRSQVQEHQRDQEDADLAERQGLGDRRTTKTTAATRLSSQPVRPQRCRIARMDKAPAMVQPISTRATRQQGQRHREHRGERRVEERQRAGQVVDVPAVEQHPTGQAVDAEVDHHRPPRQERAAGKVVAPTQSAISTGSTQIASPRPIRAITSPTRLSRAVADGLPDPGLGVGRHDGKPWASSAGWAFATTCGIPDPGEHVDIIRHVAERRNVDGVDPHPRTDPGQHRALLTPPALISTSPSPWLAEWVADSRSPSTRTTRSSSSSDSSRGLDEHLDEVLVHDRLQRAAEDVRITAVRGSQVA